MNNRLINVLLSDVTSIRVAVGLSALLYSFGLFFANSNNGSYDLMIDHAPTYLWGTAFFVYGASKFVIATRPVCRPVLYSIVMLGCYLWLFTFLSFMNNSLRGPGPADLLILILVFLEVWVGASALSINKAQHDQ